MQCCQTGALLNDSCCQEDSGQEGTGLPPPGCIAATAGGNVQAACIMQQDSEAGTHLKVRIRAVPTFSCACAAGMGRSAAAGMSPPLLKSHSSLSAAALRKSICPCAAGEDDAAAAAEAALPSPAAISTQCQDTTELPLRCRWMTLQQGLLLMLLHKQSRATTTINSDTSCHLCCRRGRRCGSSRC